MSGLPRPEYPRPRSVRPEWQCLNGEWEFCFDDAGFGLRDGWHDGRPLEGRITVPFPSQSPASGIGDPSIHETLGPYRDRTFTGKPNGAYPDTRGAGTPPGYR